MHLNEITALRLKSQCIDSSHCTTPQEVVAHMGAMQAQDYPMARWAVGKRLPGSTDRMVEDAIDRGEVIRTHLLRPTWHLVAARDVRWMLALTAPNIHASMRARHKDLGITPANMRKANGIIAKALLTDGAMTREEIASVLKRARIATEGDNRLAHILLCAELEGVVCSGPSKGKKQTFALFDERVPAASPLAREEALANLAGRFFASRGPATLADFVWWSGLRMNDARNALDLAKGGLRKEIIGGSEYWFQDGSVRASNKRNGVHLLPPFDEYMIGYRDRSAAITDVHLPRAVSSNGIFRPIVVAQGRVVGLWRRITQKRNVLIEIESLVPAGSNLAKGIKSEADAVGRFLEVPVELKFA
jgi:hypothetical protein